MKISDDVPSGLTALDRPNSYIGRSVPRPNLARLTQGRAQYVSDVTLPRMAHVAFVRSPHAHARQHDVADELPPPLRQPRDIRPRHRAADIGIRPVERAQRGGDVVGDLHLPCPARACATASTASTMA